MRLALAFVASIALTSCDSRTSTYTLYRSSVSFPNARLHIATFDSSDGDEYNRENCQLAMDLFQNQPGVKVRYWCEKGRYRS